MKEERFKISMVIISVFLIAFACIMASVLLFVLEGASVWKWISAIFTAGILGVIAPFVGGVVCLIEQFKLLSRKEKT